MMIQDDYLKMLRKHLIEQAKIGERLSYQEFSDKYVLGFEMNDIEQRKELGGLLGQISEFEHSQGRPLLSAMKDTAGQTLCVQTLCVHESKYNLDD